jgi:cysteine desulfurase
VEATQHYFRGRHRFIPITRGGVIDLDWLSEELSERRPGFVAVMAANNITGVLQPWRETQAICRQYEVPFFCDAVQWLGKLPSHGLGACDFVSGCAHKFGGPRGVGFLKCPSRGQVRPLLYGGPQEESRRAGTENVSGAISLVVAMELREKQIAAGMMHELGHWRDQFESTLRNHLPETSVAGEGQKRLWNTSACLMPPISAQRWVVKLDKLGFAVSIGSACSTGKETASHVLLAMGFEVDQAGRVLRFSSGWESKQSDWDELAAAVIQVYADAHPVKNQTAA